MAKKGSKGPKGGPKAQIGQIGQNRSALETRLGSKKGQKGSKRLNSLENEPF